MPTLRCCGRVHRNRQIPNCVKWSRRRARPRHGRPLGDGAKDTLLRRKYVIPFILACVILFCNTATGVNSIIGYNTSILLQSGLSDLYAHWGYVIFTIVNFLFTIVGLMLVDKKGEKISVGSGYDRDHCFDEHDRVSFFLRTEAHNVDVRETVQAMVKPEQTLAAALRWS